MTSNLTMHQAADFVGLSYDRFRKVWRELVESVGLPAPYLGLLWDADELKAWKRERSRRAVTAQVPEPPVANDGAVNAARLKRQRQQLAELRAE